MLPITGTESRSNRDQHADGLRAKLEITVACHEQGHLATRPTGS